MLVPFIVCDSDGRRLWQESLGVTTIDCRVRGVLGVYQLVEAAQGKQIVNLPGALNFYAGDRRTVKNNRLTDPQSVRIGRYSILLRPTKAPMLRPVSAEILVVSRKLELHSVIKEEPLETGLIVDHFFGIPAFTQPLGETSETARTIALGNPGVPHHGIRRGIFRTDVPGCFLPGPALGIQKGPVRGYFQTSARIRDAALKTTTVVHMLVSQ